VTETFKPPAPVAVAVHGVSGEPLYVTLVGQLIVVDELALSIVKVTCVAVLLLWLASPAKVASAVLYRR
jgi:hypothetical protein